MTGIMEGRPSAVPHKDAICSQSQNLTKLSSSQLAISLSFIFPAAITILKLIAVFQTAHVGGETLDLNMYSAIFVVLVTVAPTLALPPFPYWCGRYRGEGNVGGGCSNMIGPPGWGRPTEVFPTAIEWGHGTPASDVPQVATSTQAVEPVKPSPPQIADSPESAPEVVSSSTTEVVSPSAVEVKGSSEPKSKSSTRPTPSVPKPNSSSASYPAGSSGSSGGAPGPVDYVLIANSWRKLLKLDPFEYNADLEAAAQNTQNRADGQHHLAKGPGASEVSFTSSTWILGKPSAADVNQAFRGWICEMPELLTAAGVDYATAQIDLGKYGTMLAGCGEKSPAHSTAPSDSKEILHAKICSGKSTAIGCAWRTIGSPVGFTCDMGVAGAKYTIPTS